MAEAIDMRIALGNVTDLTNPTAVPKYNLGTIIPRVSNKANGLITKFIYVQAHEALTQFQPYVLDYSAIVGSEFLTGAPATLIAGAGRQVIIPQVAFTDAFFGFVLLQGDGKVIMTAETYAVGDHLQIKDGATKLNITGGTTFSENSAAICKEAGTNEAPRDTFLLGVRALVQA